MKLPYAIGKDIIGKTVVKDLTEFTHLLIGGSSGGGKSSALHSLLMCIAQQSMNDVNLLILDFGGSYLERFNGIPHMSRNVTTEYEDGLEAIKVLRFELERRQELREKNEAEFKKLPYIVCIIDEFIRFIEKITIGKDNKDNHRILSDLIERGRKEHIIMVFTALNPNLENIQIDKTSIGARIAVKCNDRWQYSNILGESPSTSALPPLVGRGTMYFKSINHELMYLQGSYIPHENISKELKKIDFVNDEKYKFRDDGKYRYKAWPSDDIMKSRELPLEQSVASESDDEEKNEYNKNLAETVMESLRERKLANSGIKTKFGLGHAKANDVLAQLEGYKFTKPKRKKVKNRIVTEWQVIPQQFEDISPELIKILNDNNYSVDDIIAAMNEGIEGCVKEVKENE